MLEVIPYHCEFTSHDNHMTHCVIQPSKQEAWPYSGRTVEKSFLYEVITSRCGLCDIHCGYR